MSDPIQSFIEERRQRVQDNGVNKELQSAADAFNIASNKAVVTGVNF